VLALAVVVAFTNFGLWQLRRHESRAAQNLIAAERLAAPPVDLATALAAARAEPEVAGLHPLSYRRVELTGTFDASVEVLRRPVARDGVPGYHVVTPLVTDRDHAVLVERGWVPHAMDQVPVTEAAPPAGEVTIRGLTFPTQRPPTGPLAAFAPRDPPTGPLRTVAYVDDQRLAAQMPYRLEPVVVVLDAPARGGGDATLPLPPLPPALDGGPHLGYAIQWFAFVLITVVGYTLLVRRVARDAQSGPVAT
jgi:surfeit locus 1 family protein